MDGLAGLLQAFSDLVSPVIRFLIWIWPLKCRVLDEGQGGVVLTCGTVWDSGGLRWRWPSPWRGPGVCWYGSAEDLVFSQTSALMGDLVEQCVVFADGRVAILNGSVVFGITDCRKALLRTHDHVLIVKEVAMNALRRWAADQPPTAITETEDVTTAVSELMNKALRRYGCRVDQVNISELRPDHVQMACDAAKTCAEMLVAVHPSPSSGGTHEAARTQ